MSLSAKRNRRTKLLFLFFLVIFFPYIGDTQVQNSEVKTLRTEIILRNLLKNLYLTQDQAKFILEKAREVEDLNKKFKEEFESLLFQQKQILWDLKKSIKEGSSIQRRLVRELHNNEYQLKKLRKEYIQELNKIAKEIEAALTDTQIYILENFKPCLVPPKDSKLIGQADFPKGLIKKLEALRKGSYKEYKIKKESLIEKLIEHISLKIPNLKEEEIKQLEEKIAKILDKVRKMSDLEFSLRKEEILKELKENFPHKEIGVDEKILRFLLNPQIIPILEEKYKN